MEAPVQPVTMEVKLILRFRWNAAVIPTEIPSLYPQLVSQQRILVEVHAQRQHRRELRHWFGVQNQV